MRRYKAMIWKPASNLPGRRVSVLATTLEDAKERLEAEYGEGSVFDLHNEDDAAQPRSSRLPSAPVSADALRR
jgi:hypothetical protein